MSSGAVITGTPGIVRRRRHIPFSHVASAIILLFLFLPLLMILLFSFTSGATTRFPIEKLTVSSYGDALANPAVRLALRNSLRVGVGTAVVSAVLATPAALAFTRYRQALGRGVHTASLVVLPLAIPSLILAIALLSFFSTLHVPLSLGTVIAGHTLICAPMVFFIVRARLEHLDPNIHEAARDLGAGEWLVFWRVTFPLIRSSIFGSMILVLAVSFDEFVIALFTIGPQSTLPLVIWSMLRRGIDSPSLSALMTMLLLVTTVVLAVASRLARITGGRRQ